MLLMIEQKCEEFGIRFLQDEIETLFSKIIGHTPLEAAAMAALLVRAQIAYYRRETELITWLKVSQVTGVPIKDIRKGVDKILTKNLLPLSDINIFRGKVDESGINFYQLIFISDLIKINYCVILGNVPLHVFEPDDDATADHSIPVPMGRCFPFFVRIGHFFIFFLI